MDAGRLNRRVTILHSAQSQSAKSGAWSASWVPLATVWAEVQDVLPSRSETIADGIEIARRPARVRMRYRTDITSAMRLQYQGREYRIVSGPAELGNRDAIEIIAELLTTEGNEA